MSFITNDDIKKCIEVFGNCSIIGIRKLKLKQNEIAVLEYNDLLNIMFSPDLSPIKNRTGI